MSISLSIFYFTLGFIIAFLFPRLPMILITRGKGFNLEFSPHPLPVKLSPKLTQRVLHMRMLYWMGFGVALIPLMFGFLSLKWGNAAFGFGLWISSGWFILSRLQVFFGGPNPPWTLEMAQRLQLVMDKSKSDDSCCKSPIIEWGLLKIECGVCNAVLDELPRPDLGRKRVDGFLAGGFRLLMSDGYPFVELDNEYLNSLVDSEE